MAEPLVSIITACYNDAHFIHLPINSVLNQPYENFEMIIVNDGSTSAETLHILEQIHHPKISIIHQKNKGLPGARNTGIRAARGEYILPLDSDDKITPICLTRSVEVLDSRPDVVMVYGNYRIFGDEDRFVPSGKFNTYKILFANYLVVCSMFRRSAWEQVGGYTENMIGFEDWEFWIKLIERGNRFERIDEVLFTYHKHGRSFWDRSKPIYKDIIDQIRSLHPRLYTKESIKRLKRENRITWLEDVIYHIPLPLRHRLGRSCLRRFIRPMNRFGLYRDL
jgi:glycosyltransferase involved in cell wall biosynthesis